MSDMALMVAAEEQAPARKETFQELVARMVFLFEVSESSEDEAERRYAIDELHALMSTDLPKKIDGICWFLGQQESDMRYAERVIEMLQARILQHESRRNRVRDLTKQAMQTAGIRSIRGTWQTLSLRAGSESVEITSMADVPLEYMKPLQPPVLSPDKPAIKRAIKANIDVPGARINTGPETLQVK